MIYSWVHLLPFGNGIRFWNIARNGTIRFTKNTKQKRKKLKKPRAEKPRAERVERSKLKVQSTGSGSGITEYGKLSIAVCFDPPLSHESVLSSLESANNACDKEGSVCGGYRCSCKEHMAMGVVERTRSRWQSSCHLV